MAYQFGTFTDFKTVFKINLERVKSGKERHAPSVAAFERVSALLPTVENNDFYRNVFLRHVNRYLKETKAALQFVLDATGEKGAQV